MYCKSIMLLEQFSSDDIRNNRANFIYMHELGWYGFEAIGLYLVMRDALRALQHNLSVEYTAQKFKIQWLDETSLMPGLLIHGWTVKNESVYVPTHMFDTRYNFFHFRKYPERISLLCGADSRNRYINNKYRESSTVIDSLTRHIWRPSDLTDKDILQAGIQASRQLLGICHYYYREEKESDTNPKELYVLGEELLDHWMTFVDRDPAENFPETTLQ